MKLLDQYRAACKVRHLASKTMAVYVRWVEQFVRFHRDRTGGWQHPSQMGQREVEAFLTHLAVNRRVAESTSNSREPDGVGCPGVTSSEFHHRLHCQTMMT